MPIDAISRSPPREVLEAGCAGGEGVTAATLVPGASVEDGGTVAGVCGDTVVASGAGVVVAVPGLGATFKAIEVDGVDVETMTALASLAGRIAVAGVGEVGAGVIVAVLVRGMAVKAGGATGTAAGDATNAAVPPLPGSAGVTGIAMAEGEAIVNPAALASGVARVGAPDEAGSSIGSSTGIGPRCTPKPSGRAGPETGTSG